MAKWQHRIKIRQYLTGGESREDMLSAEAGIRKEVERINGLPIARALEALDDMKAAAKAGKIDWFNASLNRLWDWFDTWGVWVEF